MNLRKIGKRWSVTSYTLSAHVKPDGGQWQRVTQTISRMDSLWFNRRGAQIRARVAPADGDLADLSLIRSLKETK